MIEKRDKQMNVLVSESEMKRIRLKMEELEISCLNAYVRKMALDGYCVKLELQDVKEMVSLLRRCSNNLNQYAKRANETGNIYAEDIKDLQNRFEEIWNVAKENHGEIINNLKNGYSQKWLYRYIKYLTSLQIFTYSFRM